jgi:hypothetical protein
VFNKNGITAQNEGKKYSPYRLCFSGSVSGCFRKVKILLLTFCKLSGENADTLPVSSL